MRSWERWQREFGRPIDLILQVGDLGTFAPGSPVDQATRRHAERDPEELGFAEFAGTQPPATLLDPRPRLVFVPGNHEDFPFLEERDRAARPDVAVYPVAEDGRILALRSGRVCSFDSPDGAVRIAGISGVAHRSHKKHLHPMLHLRDQDAMRLAERGPGSVDILMSHERPAGIEGSFRHDLGGSEALRLLIEAVQPRLTFFGHYDWAGESMLGRTRVVGLRGCGYVTHGDWPVKRGGIALVEWSGSEATSSACGPSGWRAPRGGAGGGGARCQTCDRSASPCQPDPLSEQVELGGVTFLGCTLWTDLELFGDSWSASLEAAARMTDYRRIRVSPAYRRLRPADTRATHAGSRRWLEKRLVEPRNGPVVVVTHQAPSRGSLDRNLAAELVSAAYASDLEALVRRSGAALWVHGHIHRAADYEIGSTRVLCNPRGYPDEPESGFDPGLVVDVRQGGDAAAALCGTSPSELRTPTEHYWSFSPTVLRSGSSGSNVRAGARDTPRRLPSRWR